MCCKHHEALKIEEKKQYKKDTNQELKSISS